MIRIKGNFSLLEEEVSKIGLNINENKTKYLHLTRNARDRVRQKVTMDEHNSNSFKSSFKLI